MDKQHQVRMPLMHYVHHVFRHPSPMKQAAEAAARRFLAGQDVLVSGERINKRSAPSGKASGLFMREFSTREHPMAIYFTTSDPRIAINDYYIGEGALKFTDQYGVSVNFVVGVVSSDLSLREVPAICFGASTDGKTAQERYVVINMDNILGVVNTLGRVLGQLGANGSEVIYLTAHDYVVDQLIISEFMLRGITLPARRDYLLAKCLFSPTPEYTMLLAFGGVETSTKHEIMRELGIATEYGVMIVPFERGTCPEEVDARFRERTTRVVHAAKSRVLRFMTQYGIHLEEVMTKDRAERVTSELLGMQPDLEETASN